MYKYLSLVVQVTKLQVVVCLSATLEGSNIGKGVRNLCSTVYHFTGYNNCRVLLIFKKILKFKDINKVAGTGL